MSRDPGPIQPKWETLRAVLILLPVIALIVVSLIPWGSNSASRYLAGGPNMHINTNYQHMTKKEIIDHFWKFGEDLAADLSTRYNLGEPEKSHNGGNGECQEVGWCFIGGTWNFPAVPEEQWDEFYQYVQDQVAKEGFTHPVMIEQPGHRSGDIWTEIGQGKFQIGQAKRMSFTIYSPCVLYREEPQSS